MKTILLKFAGPLQSWGSNSHFETRHTDYYPSKSAVIGIIAASLGYRRDEDRNIRRLNELNFAVRIDQVGTLLRDYHIARKYKSDGREDRTYVTNRYYLEDAVFVAAISHEDNSYMDEILRSLKNPYFQTFMGRRALPMCADFILDVVEDDIIEALKNYEWQAANWYKKKYKDRILTLEIYADSKLLENNVFTVRRDRVISFSYKERKFAPRYESKINVQPVNYDAEKCIDMEHDIWNIMENDYEYIES